VLHDKKASSVSLRCSERIQQPTAAFNSTIQLARAGDSSRVRDSRSQGPGGKRVLDSKLGSSWAVGTGSTCRTGSSSLWRGSRCRRRAGLEGRADHWLAIGPLVERRQSRKCNWLVPSAAQPVECCHRKSRLKTTIEGS